MFSIEELEILIEGVGTLIAEYGDRPERVVLLERLRAIRTGAQEARRQASSSARSATMADTNIRPMVAGGKLIEEIAWEIADWFGRSVNQSDRELALIIINRVRRYGEDDDHAS
jgi:hypothetical protein